MKKLLLLGMLVLPSVVWAQTGEGWFSAGESILSNNGIGTAAGSGGTPNDYKLDNGFRFGFRFTINTGTRMGHEVQYAYNRTHLTYLGVDQGGMAIHQGGYNFLYYATPEGSKFRPFATGGVHFSNFVPPGSSATYGGGSTKFGFNYGAGLKVKITSLFALRLDVRQYQTGKPDFGGALTGASGLLRQTEVSAGFGIYF
ncbi:MAG TPA: outer membrane beta-barrel protein [Bryobacteraceae bacterium]|nr:outer membrane beta-barrel protein [Bryobacteraceae bacterium]